MSGIDGKKILLIISGGIAAYKSLELIRLLRKRGCNVTGIVTIRDTDERRRPDRKPCLYRSLVFER